jgi:hypothetical protein
MAEMDAVIDFIEGAGPRPAGLSLSREARLRQSYRFFAGLHDEMMAQRDAADAAHPPATAENHQDEEQVAEPTAAARAREVFVPPDQLLPESVGNHNRFSRFGPYGERW